LEKLIPAPEAGLGDGAKAQFDASQQRQANLRAQAQQPDRRRQRQRAARARQAGAARRARGHDRQREVPRPAPRRRRRRPAERRDLRDPAALDSLRQNSPPKGGASHEEASTETERDRSLRDELMDAMKEGAPDGYDQQVERYYEELLR
jgi:hypothetical protein